MTACRRLRLSLDTRSRSQGATGKNLFDNLVDRSQKFIGSQRWCTQTRLPASSNRQPPAAILNLEALKNCRGQRAQFEEEPVILMKSDRAEDQMKGMLIEERHRFIKGTPKPTVKPAALKRPAQVRAIMFRFADQQNSDAVASHGCSVLLL
jgi:hypothetical protein